MTSAMQHDEAWMEQLLEQPAALRRAALLAHGMAHGDRTWLLSQLDAAQRAALLPLLDELAELGIPPDAAFVSEAVQMSVSDRVSGRSNPRDLLQRAERLPADAVAAVLRSEVPQLSRRIVSLRRWPWRAAVEAALADVAPASERCDSECADRRADAELTRLERRALEALLVRIGADVAAPVTSVRPAAAGHWLHRLRRLWFRPAGGIQA